MRYRYFFLLIFLSIVSCEQSYLPGFDFNNFKNSELEEISLAVKYEDSLSIRKMAINTDIDFCEPKYGNNLLMLAVANNLEKSVRTLISLGANINMESKRLNSGYTKTPLSILCSSHLKKEPCDLKILNVLLKNGVDVNKKIYSYNSKKRKDESFRTPLMIACESDCLGVVQLLINYGANINEFNYSTGESAVGNALVQENIEILKFLIINKKAKIPNYCIIDEQGKKITFFEIFDNLKLDNFPKKKKAQLEIVDFLTPPCSAKSD